jgi:hypothetical protein
MNDNQSPSSIGNELTTVTSVLLSYASDEWNGRDD